MGCLLYQAESKLKKTDPDNTGVVNMKHLIFFIFFIANQCLSQSLFKGKVISKNRVPIQNVNILDSVAQKVVVSDKEGNFIIRTNKSQIHLILSSVGYETIRSSVNLKEETEKIFILVEGIYLKDSIKIYSTRANQKTPFAYKNIGEKRIELLNNGKGLPYLLQHTPSIVLTSDAGNAIGYTGIRIRGSDPTRINVTINGIPLNDAESHGVFWVNLPDIISSTNNIQIQRGIGTSTNGSGAFGGTINIKTGTPSKEKTISYNTSMGSYKTTKHTFSFNSGLINKKWNFEGRLSKIYSDGYVDRSFSDLKSYYLAANYFTRRSSLQMINFSGKEKTYQSWWGTPEAKINNDISEMNKVIVNNSYSDQQAKNLLESGRTFNYYLYENQTDNYQQDHYQLHLNQDLFNNSNFNISLHYTYGRGYYEEMQINDKLSNYNLANIVIGNKSIASSDIIRQRWLDNDFYGLVFSYILKKENELIVGGAWNKYVGNHFGKIIWGQYLPIEFFNKNYYNNKSIKKDGNFFVKKIVFINNKIKIFTDLQTRFAIHSGEGTDNKKQFVNFQSNYLFFNPKLGVNYSISEKSQLYVSYARSNREPVRSDFVDSIKKPKHETLFDYEIGFKQKIKKGTININFYWMQYKNQLLLTGEVNDVGGYIRKNAEKSKRFGVEFENNLIINSQLSMDNNITLAKNLVFNYNEIIYDYGINWNEFNIINNRYKKTNLAFSPSIIASNTILWYPMKQLGFHFFSKYISSQNLDNTSKNDRIILPYFINNLMINYNVEINVLNNLFIKFQINNLFNELYESNGYTFGYFAGINYEVRENYYYPQAERNFLISLELKF